MGKQEESWSSGEGRLGGKTAGEEMQCHPQEAFCMRKLSGCDMVTNVCSHLPKQLGISWCFGLSFLWKPLRFLCKWFFTSLNFAIQGVKSQVNWLDLYLCNYRTHLNDFSKILNYIRLYVDQCTQNIMYVDD